jgi:hypothetical protein
MLQYDEADFVAYALKESNIPVVARNGKYFELENGFLIEVEGRDLYKLSVEGWVISPFDDIGLLCSFIKKNNVQETQKDG